MNIDHLLGIAGYAFAGIVFFRFVVVRPRPMTLGGRGFMAVTPVKTLQLWQDTVVRIFAAVISASAWVHVWHLFSD